jgi:hypothetical protein
MSTKERGADFLQLVNIQSAPVGKKQTIRQDDDRRLLLAGVQRAHNLPVTTTISNSDANH